MNKLRKKTFLTIFGIISLFIIVTFLFFNIQNYSKEYDNIKNNLTRMNHIVMDRNRPEDRIPMESNDLGNRIIMDYDIYTVLLDKNNNILEIINHSDDSQRSDIELVSKKILDNEDEDAIKIGNLYFSKYSYNLKNGNFLIVVDNQGAESRLLSVLFTSLLLFVLLEIVSFFISRVITNLLIKPAEDSFNKQKDFIADASHELKTPLAVIMASADSLVVNKKSEKWLDNIKLETDRMNKLITSLLDLSKLESGVNKSIYSMNDLSRIIKKCTLTFESLAFENSVTIETDIESNIMFKCSASEMNELLGILLDNAIKHSEKNSFINVNLENYRNEIVLEVINKGDEIPKEDYEKIFERFYRVDKSRNRSSNRYGLGLAIAKNIVNNHGGNIKAFSRDGYTTFKVVFKNKDR